MAREIITRRSLPHWFMPNAMHFVTFRLAGTIPAEVLERLKSRKHAMLSKLASGDTDADQRARVHKILFAEYDKYLDNNNDIRWLDDPRIAAMVRRSLYYWDGEK